MELHRTDEGFALYKEKTQIGFFALPPPPKPCPACGGRLLSLTENPGRSSAPPPPPQRGLPSPRLASNRSGGAKATAPIY